jgi:uncharacterized hydrophobic protein (TIGR00271 family)
MKSSSIKYISINKLVSKINSWLQKKASRINHKAVIKDIYEEVDVSVGYFLVLSLANLIALGGLVTDSAPVIIGAMLISPLMGPILSIGFAFITGEKVIWTKSVKKISISIILTVVVAAIATYLSPLKEITHEIIVRTRPNLYDLAIAFFAGTAGAAAICTKKNYLTIVPGVAIATAVIPPLSVAGFGIGTGHFNIFFGGFFLFFTNLVAMILSTCAVFYFYGFRPLKIAEEMAQLKRRMIFLGTVLLVISIPLIYTLQQSISEVRLTNNVQQALKKEFNRKGSSNISTFDYSKNKDGSMEINAVVNTVKYLKDPEINAAQKNMEDYLGRNVKLSLEQVKVQPGGLKEEVMKPISPTIVPPKPPSEIIKSTREDAISVLRQSADKIDQIISPATVADYFVGFHDKTHEVSVVLKIMSDKVFSDDEILWMKRMITSDLNLPVDLKVETIPFVPPLSFIRGETGVTEEMKKNLLPLKIAFNKDKNIAIMIESYPESSFGYKKRVSLAEARAKSVRTVLSEDFGIPESNIKVEILKNKVVKTPTIITTIFTGQKKS